MKFMSEPFFEKTDVFTARTHGFYTYRIPTIVVTQKGTILAFSEARVGTPSDWAKMSIVMRRSLDNGKTWGPLIKVVSNEEETAHNMVAIVSIDSNLIHFLYTLGYRRVFYMESKDDGQSFSKPKEISQIFEKYKPQVVIHAAAHKHVPLMEINAGEAIKTILLVRRLLLMPLIFTELLTL